MGVRVRRSGARQRSHEGLWTQKGHRQHCATLGWTQCDCSSRAGVQAGNGTDLGISTSGINSCFFCTVGSPYLDEKQQIWNMDCIHYITPFYTRDLSILESLQIHRDNYIPKVMGHNDRSLLGSQYLTNSPPNLKLRNKKSSAPAQAGPFLWLIFLCSFGQAQRRQQSILAFSNWRANKWEGPQTFKRWICLFFQINIM